MCGIDGVRVRARLRPLPLRAVVERVAGWNLIVKAVRA